MEHEREVYSCRRCERENIRVPVIKAPMPEAPIKGSAASAASIAHIMVQKYMNGMPLYRTGRYTKTPSVLYEYQETMPNIPKENYHTLLPWSKDLPDSLRLEQNNIAPAQ